MPFPLPFPLPLVKKTYKKDIIKWLLQYYDPENKLTHYDYINILLGIIFHFIGELGLRLSQGNIDKFRGEFISYLYYNSSHKRYFL